MKYTIVVSVFEDEEVLSSTLLRSPFADRGSKIMCQRGFPTVSAAYNDAIRKCDDEYMVFVHPDVYFPYNWHGAFMRSLDWLQKNDPEWGILGLYGVAGDGKRLGFTFSTGRGSFLGVPFDKPKKVRTVDEFVFVLRKSSGFQFDENLPTAQNHLAATDLCILAESRGMNSYVLPCFAIHNSNRWSNLPLNFWKSYLYIRKKWRSRLPIEVPYVRITAGCMPMVISIFRFFLKIRTKDIRVNTRVSNPDELYKRLRLDLSYALEGKKTKAVS